MTKKTTGLLAFAALVAAGLAAAPPRALARRHSAARSCAKIAADAERLACYDHAFRAARAGKAQPGHKESSPQASAATQPAAGSKPVAAAKSRAKAPAGNEASAERNTQPKATAANSGKLEVTIVKIRHIRQIGEAFFVTNDGHVWRQTDQRQTIFPKPPFQAFISSGFLGSHVLSPVGERTSVHVSEEPQ